MIATALTGIILIHIFGIETIGYYFSLSPPQFSNKEFRHTIFTLVLAYIEKSLRVGLTATHCKQYARTYPVILIITPPTTTMCYPVYPLSTYDTLNVLLVTFVISDTPRPSLNAKG